MFRKPEFGNKVFLIAVPNESLTATWTLMDLQGNLDKQFQVRFCTSKNAARPKEKEIWPETPEENLERLADCGVPVDRRVPKCSNCNGKNSGRTSTLSHLLIHANRVGTHQVSLSRRS